MYWNMYIEVIKEMNFITFSISMHAKEKKNFERKLLIGENGAQM